MRSLKCAVILISAFARKRVCNCLGTRKNAHTHVRISRSPDCGRTALQASILVNVYCRLYQNHHQPLSKRHHFPIPVTCLFLCLALEVHMMMKERWNRMTHYPSLRLHPFLMNLIMATIYYAVHWTTDR